MAAPGTPMAAATDATDAVTGRVTVIMASQALVPSHTPQLSNVPSQHRPDGATACRQHTPATSTIVPLPPHTPHASRSSPTLQQRPLLSVTAPTGQHRPVTLSMLLDSQHRPLPSTMIAADEQLPPTVGDNSAWPQSAPPHPSPHSHKPVPLQTKFGPTVTQSDDVEHAHGPALQRCSRAGVANKADAHTLSLSTDTEPCEWHSTLRTRTPCPHCSTSDVFGCRHGLQAPTTHVTMPEGHGKRLHDADVDGGVSPALTHSPSSTTAVVATALPLAVSLAYVRTHVGGDDVVTPNTRGSDVNVSLPAPRLSHGAEHVLQSLDGTHVSVGHGWVLHTC